MSYRLPPLNGLRAFEAAARHLSFKSAASELSVTRGAVAQQIKKLEAALGKQLFQRNRNRLTLTADGEQYLPHVSQAFRALSEATETFAPALGGRVFRLGVAPALMDGQSPILARLGMIPGNMRPQLLRTDDLEMLREGDADALLRIADGPYPTFHTERIAVDVLGKAAVTLVTQPGLAGCREHRAIVRLLRNQGVEDKS